MSKFVKMLKKLLTLWHFAVQAKHIDVTDDDVDNDEENDE